MTNIKAGLFDRYVLKPLWLLYIVLFLRYFINAEWIVGGFLVVMWFLISVIGQSLHPNMTAAEMAKGTTPSKKEIDNDPNPNELNDIEAILISKASFRVAGLIGITAIVLSWSHGMRWYYSALVGGGVWLLSMVIVPTYSLYLIGHKMKKSNNN